MDLNSIPLFEIMKGKLNYHSQRQSILAQNVANADTPGYQAKDLAAPDFKAMAQANSGRLASSALPIARTNEKHMAGMGSGKPVYTQEKRPSTYERNPNGNNVSLEEEMMLVANNQAEYQKVISLYRKSVEMFKTALGRGGQGA